MRTESQLAADFALLIFKVNGQMLDVGERLARPVGLTVARWQVLGAVLGAPLTAAGIAREMGISRQAVQRVANALVEDGFLEPLANPAHKRAPLFAPTESGLAAMRRIAPAQAAYAAKLILAFGRRGLERLVKSLNAISPIIEQI